jgi:MFS family permease
MPDTVSPHKPHHPRKDKIWGFPRNVFFMGWASFFTDISSEMINSVLPFFLANVIGASKTTIGIIEGIAESTASILKVVSGWLSDKMQRRKPLVVWGYSLSTFAKSFLPIAGTSTAILAYRFVERFGKGIRAAPRDAFIADSTPANLRGKSFGFHKAMDTAGAVIGPLIAFIILSLSSNNGYKTIFWIAIFPAVISILILIFFVHEKRKSKSKLPEDISPAPQEQAVPTDKTSLQGFHISFFVLIGIVVIFTIGNPSDAFLLLRAENVGVPLAIIPLAYLLSNLMSSLLALPAGVVSDRIGRAWLILGGYIIFSLVYWGFAHVDEVWLVFVLFAFYGMHVGMTEGVIKAFIADLVPTETRGTAYGVYHTAVGLTLLPASIIAGLLWQHFGASVPFYFGFITSLIAVVLMLIWFFIMNIGKISRIKEPPVMRD